MVKRIRKFTVRTAGAAAVLMVLGFMPAVASAGPVTCTACLTCLASCTATFGILCPACILPCIGCPLPIPYLLCPAYILPCIGCPLPIP